MEVCSQKKLSAQEIGAKFDTRVEAYSNQETGQQTAMDSPLMMELVAATIKTTAP